MKFHEKLLKLRKEKGLSQEELGMEMQVSRQTISKWESGQSYPDFTKLVMLSDYFHMTLDELVKDLDVQEVRENPLTNEKIDSIYRISQEVDSVLQNKTAKNVGKGICWFLIGSCIFLCVVFLVSFILHLIFPESTMFWRTY
ncbi:MAG: helix-turn-helix transcriptional regulator [Lachnospiraceae bacterium]|jgi:transcriptional regulator with XRE-family HTH domain|nr:helix-turn-helix transcriptional regulator [Lachnospiraceae bacterium]MCI8996151.1 helix-turn-helix transcriptional regulator [Lachnospiraceae bacterium]